MSTIGVWLGRHADLPLIDRQVLLMDALKIDRAAVVARPETPIPDVKLQQIDRHAEALRTGTPLAYVRGYKEFWGRCFEVNPSVLVPRPETELLVERVLAVTQRNDRVIDMGTGSGIIAISVALERPDLTVTAVDQSEDALAVAQGNAARLRADVTFLHSNWFSAVERHYDVVVSNPPYVAAADPALKHLSDEPLEALAAGPEGLDDLQTIIGEFARSSARHLLLEHGADQGAAVRQLMHSAGMQHVHTHRDLAGHERVSEGTRNG